MNLVVYLRLFRKFQIRSFDRTGRLIETLEYDSQAIVGAKSIQINDGNAVKVHRNRAVISIL